MAFVRTALIIMALLIGWTALRHQGMAHAPDAPKALAPAAPASDSQPTAAGGAG